MIVSALAFGASGPIALVLLAAVAYGLAPTARRFHAAIISRE